MTQTSDRWYGMPLHECRVGREGMGFFHRNGAETVAIFFSQAQALQLVDRFASCFKSEEVDDVCQSLADPEYLPVQSPQEPILIGGRAGKTLVAAYRAYHGATREGTREIGYESLPPRVIGYFHTPNIDTVCTDPASTLIAVKDAKGGYHVHVVFSDADARRVLHLYREDVSLDMAYYERLMACSPLPMSDQPAIHLGDAHAPVSAHDLCLAIDVFRGLQAMEASSAQVPFLA